MCAPRDQRKSSDNQCEQVELNTLRCQRRADVSGDVIARGKPKLAKPARGQIAERAVMEGPLMADSVEKVFLG